MIDGHGGDIYQLAATLGCHVSEIIDMSSNVNPLGPMPELLTHLTERLDSVACLPQVDALAIRTVFADQHGVDPHLVMAGNGSTQWIYTLPLALKARRAIILGPAYADYADACIMHGTKVRYWLTSAADHFKVGPAQLSHLAAQADLVFICNPNNPTGRLIPAEALSDVCHTHPETTFVIDESYLPFVPQCDTHSLLGQNIPNLVVISSLSKIYRLPGLRIGFIKTSPKLARLLAPYCLPWSVNSLAAAAVLWLAQNRKTVSRFIDRSRRFIQTERDLFYHSLADIHGLTCFESCTSYILIRLPENIDSTKVWTAMAENKILIRDCRNFHGLSDRFIRISLKRAEENLKATKILIKLC